VLSVLAPRAATALAPLLTLAALAAPAAHADSSCDPAPHGAPVVLDGAALVPTPGRIVRVEAAATAGASTPEGIAATAVPSLFATDGAAPATAAWRTDAGQARVASLSPSTPATTTPSNIAGDPVLTAGDVVTWTEPDGPHLVRLGLDRASLATTGTPLGTAGDQAVQLVADRSGTAWALIAGRDGALRAQRLPADGTLPPPVTLAGTTRLERLHLIADGTGGAFLLRVPDAFVDRVTLRVVHLGSTGGASRPVTAARAESDHFGATAGAIARDGDHALLAYAKAAHGHLDAFTRTVAADGRLGPERNLTRTRGRDEYVAAVDLTPDGRGLAGLIVPGRGDSTATGAVTFRRTGAGHAFAVSAAPQEADAPLVAATRTGGYVVWGRYPVRGSRFSDADVVGRRVGERATLGPVLPLAGSTCATAE
jgi:hypothetical protein